VVVAVHMKTCTRGVVVALSSQVSTTQSCYNEAEIGFNVMCLILNQNEFGFTRILFV
jgi:hypothetical protein